MTTPTHDHIPERDETIVGHPDQAAVSNSVRVSRFSWSPAQWIAAAIGLFLVVMGAVALLRVGLDSLTGDVATVVTFEHTALMGIVDLLVGLFFLGIAGSALRSRSGLITLGMLCIAFGLVIAIEPDAMAEAVGGDQGLGWFYAVIGAISVVTAFASPTYALRKSSAVEVVEEQI
ncbi:hypothetical protein BH18ACT5_BH18ACT5_18460 [soil metagenome]